MKVEDSGVYIKVTSDTDGSVAFLRKENINCVSYIVTRNVPKVNPAPVSNITPTAVVLIEQIGGRVTSIPLGSDNVALNVSNQATWTNNEAGAIQAVEDIQSWN